MSYPHIFPHILKLASSDLNNRRYKRPKAPSKMTPHNFSDRQVGITIQKTMGYMEYTYLVTVGIITPFFIHPIIVTVHL